MMCENSSTLLQPTARACIYHVCALFLYTSIGKRMDAMHVVLAQTDARDDVGDAVLGFLDGQGMEVTCGVRVY